MNNEMDINNLIAEASDNDEDINDLLNGEIANNNIHSKEIDEKAKKSPFEVMNIPKDKETKSNNGRADVSNSSEPADLYENQAAIFEDILHPEMTDAVQTLEQLDFEEQELTTRMSKLSSGVLRTNGHDVNAKQNKELLQALLMELEIRRREKVKVIETMKRVEEERTDYTRQIIKEVQNLRKNNAGLKQMMLSRDQRQEGNISDSADVYDWVVDVSLLGDLAKDGWQVVFSPKFYNKMHSSGNLEAITLAKESAPQNDDDSTWAGAVIAVVGLYDKGKTYVLNQITQSNLPSGKKCTTKGLSFKHVSVESTNFVLLDSAGSYSPVKVENELSVAQKEATELFLLDLIFDLSDYFICVVNDFTSLDQRYLDKLTRGLQQSNKVFREVIVVHNLKEVTSAQVLAHVWETQVTQIYSGGARMTTQVAAVDPETGKLVEKHVEWFKTKYSRHICLANHDSDVGKSINPWTISLLRYWLKSVFVPVDRRFSVVNAVIHHSNMKLSTYFKDTIRLSLVEGENERIKYIRPKSSELLKDGGSFRLPQVALDASGLMLTRPDSFIPPVDIVHMDNYYTIYMDVPGLSSTDITLGRQNVMTIIKGTRKPPVELNNSMLEKQERKYGEFTMTFNIPHKYERKWHSCTVENGVLCIKFAADDDDAEQVLDKHAIPHNSLSGNNLSMQSFNTNSGNTMESKSDHNNDEQMLNQTTSVFFHKHAS